MDEATSAIFPAGGARSSTAATVAETTASCAGRSAEAAAVDTAGPGSSLADGTLHGQ